MARRSATRPDDWPQQPRAGRRPRMLFARESGILLHPTSLPGPYGLGEIGSEAIAWLETLHAMGQRLWQLLPLGPTGFGDSPYQNLSTFAAGPLLLSLEALIDRGLLDRAAVRGL